MNMIWLCISSVLSIASVISGLNIDTSHIRVLPAGNQTVAGVFQVSFLNHLNQPEYAFNASEARGLCLSLGVVIASKADVQGALSRGLETCRFGWIDEHFAVIPRIKALSNCGKSQTGLVMWRTPLNQKFDVFCFNETDAATQLTDTTTDSPLSSTDYSGETNSTQTARSTSSSSPPPSSPSDDGGDDEAKPARYVSGAQGSAGAKAVLITSTCALLLIAIIVFVYLKLRRRSQSSDMKQQQEYVETEDWTGVKKIKEPEDAQEDERIEMDNAS